MIFHVRYSRVIRFKRNQVAQQITSWAMASLQANKIEDAYTYAAEYMPPPWQIVNIEKDKED